MYVCSKPIAAVGTPLGGRAHGLVKPRPTGGQACGIAPVSSRILTRSCRSWANRQSPNGEHAPARCRSAAGAGGGSCRRAGQLPARRFRVGHAEKSFGLALTSPQLRVTRRPLRNGPSRPVGRGGCTLGRIQRAWWWCRSGQRHHAVSARGSSACTESCFLSHRLSRHLSITHPLPVWYHGLGA